MAEYKPGDFVRVDDRWHGEEVVGRLVTLRGSEWHVAWIGVAGTVYEMSFTEDCIRPLIAPASGGEPARLAAYEAAFAAGTLKPDDTSSDTPSDNPPAGPDPEFLVGGEPTPRQLAARDAAIAAGTIGPDEPFEVPDHLLEETARQRGHNPDTTRTKPDLAPAAEETPTHTEPEPEPEQPSIPARPRRRKRA